MKQIFKLAIVATIIVSSITACRPEKKELGPKANQVDGISSSAWILSKVDQIDVRKRYLVERDGRIHRRSANGDCLWQRWCLYHHAWCRKQLVQKHNRQMEFRQQRIPKLRYF
jgi:hypothetical protein